jgi:hypothetical protein
MAAKESGIKTVGILLCSLKTGPSDMLEFPEVGKEDSDGRNAVQ